jgi:hypothetical protein
MKLLTLTLIAIMAFAGIAPAKAPETLNLRLGQSKTADRGKITVKFISVLEDSRCPMNAKCVWAGNAKIRISVTRVRGGSTVVELNSTLEPQIVNVYGYRLSLQDLIPQKGAPPNMGRRPTTATISIEKTNR